MWNIVTSAELAAQLRCSAHLVERMMTEAKVPYVRGWSAAEAAAVIESFGPDWHPHMRAYPLPPGVIVPHDAELPDTVVHQPTGWIVHPAEGTVYSPHGKNPQRIGTPNGHGLMRARRKWPDKTSTSFTIAQVVWTAVNGRDVPDGWAVGHRSNDRTDDRYPNLALAPIGTARGTVT